MIPKHMPQHLANQWYHHFRFSMVGFWSPLYGFDVVKLDDRLKTPDGVSMREHLRKTHGDKAVEYVEALMKL